LKTFLTQIGPTLPLTPDPPVICFFSKWIGWKDYEVPNNHNLKSVCAEKLIFHSPTLCIPAPSTRCRWAHFFRLSHHLHLCLRPLCAGTRAKVEEPRRRRVWPRLVAPASPSDPRHHTTPASSGLAPLDPAERAGGGGARPPRLTGGGGGPPQHRAARGGVPRLTPADPHLHTCLQPLRW
jgi:hypothetical protein